MEAEELSIRAHIAAREDQKGVYQRLWEKIVELDESVGLTESTKREFQAKISSKIAGCDISIRDHTKLLPK